MNPPSNGVREFPVDAQKLVSAPLTETRPMYWSVRRELWENRSVYLAPLIVTAVVLFASLINTSINVNRMRKLPAIERPSLHSALARPFDMAPAPIMFATLLVGLFYSLDALYGERRDRSILFWKSLPVSDRTVVLSKALIPLVVLPLIALALSVVTQVILLWLGTLVLVTSGMSPAALWSEVHFFQGLLIMPYGLFAHILWFAPIYCWLLLISSWARRAPVLWALLPLLAVSALEKIAFGTMHFMSVLTYRMSGAMAEAFAFTGTSKSDGNVDRLSQLDPIRFLSAPGLWVGLAFAAAFLAAAIRLRRNREPI